MKTKLGFKRVTALFVAVAMILTAIVSAPLPAGAQTIDFYHGYVSGDWTYEWVKYDNGVETAGIVGYSGTQTDIAIPSEIDGYPVVELCDWAFSPNINLKSIIIPKSVTQTSCGVFWNCKNLETVTFMSLIPPSVCYGDDEPFIFENCNKLTTMYVPIGAKAAYEAAFTYAEIGCDWQWADGFAVEEVEFCDTCGEYPCVCGFVIGNNGDLTAYNGLGGDVIIPEGIINISGNVFMENESIKSVKIPNSVKCIGFRAFADCKNLTSVEIGGSVDWIGESAFAGCTNLTSITLPNSIRTISCDAFFDSGLTSVIFPKDILDIEETAFEDCKNLTSLIFMGFTPPNIWSNAFVFTSVSVVYVPVGAKAAYEAVEPLKQYDIVETDSESGRYTVNTVAAPSMELDNVWHIGNGLVAEHCYDIDVKYYVDIYDGKTGELMFEKADFYHGLDDWEINYYYDEEIEPEFVTVQKDGRWYLINAAHEIIPVAAEIDGFDYDDDYDEPLGFCEGLASVFVWGETQIINGLEYRFPDKYGFINTKGELVVPMIYDCVEPFRDGMSMVQMNYDWVENDYGGTYTSWKFGYVNAEGEEVVPLQYKYAHDFNEGFARVVKEVNGVEKWGFVNKKGEETVPLQYDFAYDFSEGMAYVCKDNKYGFVDASGELVIPLRDYSVWESFKNGLAEVRENGKHGLIDKKGEYVVPTEYSRIYGGFCEGLLGVEKDGKSGFINKEGEVAVPFVYEYVHNFNNGIARVCSGSSYQNWKYGFIDKNGNEVVSVKYDYAHNFNEGRAAVISGGKWGFVDENGNEVVPLRYNTVGDFLNGRALVRFNDKWGMIDKNGEIVIPIEYNLIYGDILDYNRNYYLENAPNPFPNNLFVAVSGADWWNRGLVSGYDGESVVSPDYELIIFAASEGDTDYFWVCKDELWGIISVTDNYADINNPDFIAPIEQIIDKTDWIAVSDRAGLEAIADNLSGKYYLTNDIDLAGEEWVPLGDYDFDNFKGIFDGQGHVIRNMTISGEHYFSGLFGYSDGGVIRNTGLENASIDSTFWQAGGIIACAENNSVIANCYNASDITVAEGDIGGIAGFVHGSTVTDCYNTGNLTSVNGDAGGICYGAGGGDSQIRNCYNTGNLIACDSAGGICCIMGAITISQCYNSGDVSVSSDFYASAGGLIGEGDLDDGRIYINDCYNTGDVTALAGEYAYAGGVKGDVNRTIFTNCYNAGAVSASTLTGENVNAFDLPLPIEELRKKSTFEGYDFDNIWKFSEGVNDDMPILRVFKYNTVMPVYNCDVCKDSGAHCTACCTIDDCPICNPRPAFKLGDVDDDGDIDIFDALEILKYIVGMESDIQQGNTSWSAAVITSGVEPGIYDALEILKFLVGMANLINN